MGASSILRRKLETIKRRTVKVVAVTALNHCKDSFRNQGFTDSQLEKWVEPQRRQMDSEGADYKYDMAKYWGGKRAVLYSKADRTRAILVKSGDLRRSLKVVKAIWPVVQISSDLPYAAIHNNGGPIRGGAMPKRPFMGNSKKMEQAMVKEIVEVIQSEMDGLKIVVTK